MHMLMVVNVMRITSDLDQRMHIDWSRRFIYCMNFDIFGWRHLLFGR